MFNDNGLQLVVNMIVSILRGDTMKNNLIVKHNDLIQARYNLSLNEQKVILYAASQIDRDRDDFNIITISVKEFTELLGTTQERYTEFKGIAESLISKTLYINKDGSELVTSWLSSMEYITDKGVIELEFSRKLIPYLLQLKERFTRYQLENILYLENKYSIRIYELMKQYQNIGKREFELQELKKILMIEGQYERVYDLERRILKPSMEEINKHTDINIDYEKIKTGRRITSILFTVENKDQEQKVYNEYLKEFYNIKEMQVKMGLQQENFSASQVMEIYEKAIQKTQDEMDPFEYVRLNYLHMIEKGTARNKYSYLLSALEEDYAVAGSQLSLLNMYN